MRSLFRAVFTGFALLATPVLAQEADYANQVRGYLEYDMAAHAPLGYQRDRGGPEVVVPLELGSPYLWAVTLRAGVNYRIYGACDDDCTDLDMEIYDASGRLADRDVAADDKPYVQITPERTGPHYVRMWLYACDAEPCFSGARVIYGGTPRERAPAAQTATIAEGGHAQVVQSELDAASAPLDASGATRFGDDAIAPLALNAEHSVTVTLERRVRYTFVGACDQDCSDVNLEIIDARGRRVAIDRATNDRPSVSISPGSAGEFVVRATLAQCSAEPCYVGIRGFQR